MTSASCKLAMSAPSPPAAPRPAAACSRCSRPWATPFTAYARLIARREQQQPTAGQQAAAAGGWRQRQRHPLRPLTAASDAGYETDNDGQTVDQRLTMVRNMVATAELLVPYDRSAVNLGLILWGAIRNIPHADRQQLLSRLNSADIKRLWKIAGQRYSAPRQQVAAAIGPEYSIFHDLPSAAGQLGMFRGKAALPTHILGISSFSKAFFLHPDTDQLYGRVLLGKGPLGDLLYPLYFRADVGTFVVPTTQEPCDMRLQYQTPEELGLTRDSLPRSAWPQPRSHLPPFHEGFTDYIRAVGPGVYVGLGYRTASTEVNEPLYFLMVHQRIESLV